MTPTNSEILTAFENGQLESVATKAALVKFKAAARAIATMDGRVNVGVSPGDLERVGKYLK